MAIAVFDLDTSSPHLWWTRWSPHKVNFAKGEVFICLRPIMAKPTELQRDSFFHEPGGGFNIKAPVNLSIESEEYSSGEPFSRLKAHSHENFPDEFVSSLRDVIDEMKAMMVEYAAEYMIASRYYGDAPGGGGLIGEISGATKKRDQEHHRQFSQTYPAFNAEWERNSAEERVIFLAGRIQGQMPTMNDRLRSLGFAD